jgi:hypothetical protein
MSDPIALHPFRIESFCGSLRFLRFPFAFPAVNGRGSCRAKARKNERKKRKEPQKERKGASAVEVLQVMAAMDHRDGQRAGSQGNTKWLIISIHPQSLASGNRCGGMRMFDC